MQPADFFPLLTYLLFYGVYRHSLWRYELTAEAVVAEGRLVRLVEYRASIPLRCIEEVVPVRLSLLGMLLVFWKGEAVGNIRSRGLRLRVRGLTFASQVPYVGRLFPGRWLYLSPDDPEGFAAALSRALS